MIESIDIGPSYSAVAHGEEATIQIVTDLIKQSALVAVTPYPDDEYHIVVRADNARLLNEAWDRAEQLMGDIP